MSLNGIINADLAETLKTLSVEDFVAIAKAGSLGLAPEDLHAAVQVVARGEEVPLPEARTGPHPLTIQAWSFVRDHGQYADTYGLTSARAGELMDLLRSDPEKGIAEITKVVTEALRKKGSSRPVIVTRAGMPGGETGGKTAPVGGKSGLAALKEEIRRNPATYGLYSFTAEDTGRSGDTKFRVSLGGGLYATFPNKKGAVDIARITRVNGRRHPLVVDHVAFWPQGSSPKFGEDIPKEATFTGMVGPSEKPPANPQKVAKTTA